MNGESDSTKQDASAVAAATAGSEWRPVWMGLPGTYEPVLVAGVLDGEDSPACHEAFYCGRNWWSVRQDEYDYHAKRRIHQVGHWMPMPAIPNSGAG